MSEIKTVRVQVEGLEDLRALVHELRRAAEALEKAGRVAQDAIRSGAKRAER